MNFRRISCLLLILALPFPFSLWAGGDVGASIHTRISEDNLHDMIMRMGDKKVGELLTNKQHMLGGDCKVVENRIGLALFTLAVPGKDPLRFGIKKPSGYNVSFRGMENAGFKKFRLPHITPNYAYRSEDERIVALKEMGAAFKAEIVGRRWPCGQSHLESRRISLADLKKEVKLYKDERSGEIICIAPTGKENKIRKQTSCEYEPVLSELPSKLCRYLVHLVRSETEDALAMATRNAKQGRGKDVKIAPPKILPWTDDLETRLTLSRFLNKEPEMYGLLKHAHIPTADDFLGQDILDFISRSTGGDQAFDSLSPELKLDLTGLALSVESIRGEGDFVSPSPELLEIVVDIKPHADRFIKSNPALSLDLPTFPRKADLVEYFNARFASFNQIRGSSFDVSLSCPDRPRTPINTAQIRRVLRKNLPEGPDFKIDEINEEIRQINR